MSDVVAVPSSRLDLRRLVWPAAVYVWCGVAMIACIAKPYANWDSIGYAAAIYSWRFDDPARIHMATYDDVRAVTPSGDMERLESDNPYRRAIFSDPVALKQQIPHYSIRPLYLLTGWTVAQATGNVTAALRWVSALSMFATALVMYHAFARRIGPRLAAVVVALLAASPYFLELARINTADAPTVLVTAIAGVLVLNGRLVPGAFVLLIGTGVRTDIGVFAAALAGGLVVVSAWQRRMERDRAFAAGLLVAAAALSQVIEHVAGNYGLAMLHHHEFVDRVVYPADASYTLDVRFMIATSLHEAWRAVVVGFLWFPLALLAAGWYVSLTTRRASAIQWALLLGITGALAARIALYPLLEVRFLTPTVVAAACLLVWMASERPTQASSPASPEDSPASLDATIIPA